MSTGLLKHEPWHISQGAKVSFHLKGLYCLGHVLELCLSQRFRLHIPYTTAGRHVIILCPEKAQLACQHTRVSSGQSCPQHEEHSRAAWPPQADGHSRNRGMKQQSQLLANQKRSRQGILINEACKRGFEVRERGESGEEEGCCSCR